MRDYGRSLGTAAGAPCGLDPSGPSPISTSPSCPRLQRAWGPLREPLGYLLPGTLSSRLALWKRTFWVGTLWGSTPCFSVPGDRYGSGDGCVNVGGRSGRARIPGVGYIRSLEFAMGHTIKCHQSRHSRLREHMPGQGRW